MIYIDPPYNTGKDFVYRDNFKKNKTDYELELGRDDEESGERLFRNTETNGRFHSDWCSMIYPRLKLARDFLRDDGVIFISIDDNEVANLRKICDEVFGEGNFVSQFIWERAYAPKNDAKFVSNSHDYVLMFAKQLDRFTIGRLERTDEANSRYSNPDNDSRGVWKPSDMSVKTYTESCDYPITTPSGRIVEPPAGRCWSLSKNAFLERLQDNRIWFGPKGDSTPSIKRFLAELKFDGMAPTSILFYKEVGHSQEGAKEVKDLIDGNGIFDGPKPVRLLRRLLRLANTDKDSIILDFFSGSATTAHAVMQLNAEDGGNGKRKFILVQLPEKTSEDSEAYNVGYKNICEIGKERICRAGEKIKAEHAMTAPDLDVGFRVLKLDDTNMKDVYYAPSELKQSDLIDNVNNIKDDRTPLDLLFGVMIDWGLQTLTSPIAEKKVGKNTIYIVGDNDLATCFDADVPDDVIREIAALHPTRAVFRDSFLPATMRKSMRLNCSSPWLPILK